MATRKGLRDAPLATARARAYRDGALSVSLWLLPTQSGRHLAGQLVSAHWSRGNALLADQAGAATGTRWRQRPPARLGGDRLVRWPVPGEVHGRDQRRTRPLRALGGATRIRERGGGANDEDRNPDGSINDPFGWRDWDERPDPNEWRE
jgi:hypothetical protein